MHGLLSKKTFLFVPLNLMILLPKLMAGRLWLLLTDMPGIALHGFGGADCLYN
jgi:hypothetical protein